MTYTIHPPQHIAIDVQLPTSKSISNRALIIHALTNQQQMPQNVSNCDDTQVMIDALKNNPYTIDIKAAGTAMRFMTAYLSAKEGEHIITGTERMQQRPIGILVDALRYLGADINYQEKEGFPPLLIKGKLLKGGSLSVLGNISSQYISALLMIAPMLQNGLQLKLTGTIISRPYIDLTLCMMRDFGAIANWDGADTIRVKAHPYSARPYRIESDWSAASYWYEIAALCNDEELNIRLTGLENGSVQGDSVTKYLFSLLGIKTQFHQSDSDGCPYVTLHRKPTTLPRLEYDFTGSPDLAQTFVVCCAMMGIKFHFKGLSTLKIKETDRIFALKKEMRKLGYVITERNDSELLWEGERCQPTLDPIDTYEDHRMAMAFAPVALVIPGLQINNPEVVSKSYPNFWNDMKKAGFTF